MSIVIGIILASIFVLGGIIGIWSTYRRNRSKDVFDSTTHLLPGPLNGRRTPDQAEDGTPTRV